MMKKLFAILLAIAMVATLLAVLPVSASADQAEPSVWSGKANIKWYIDGKEENAEEWHIKTAEDLAGLAYLVNACDSCYMGVYYDENYDVIGYKLTDVAEMKSFADTSLLHKQAAGDGYVDGYNFEYENIYLEADIVLNTGNAADWGETPPANVWQPIGGGLPNAPVWPSFNGIFQGDGHTISGAYCAVDPAKDIYGIALFGVCGNGAGAQFRNLTVENCYFSGSYALGTICGRGNGNITIKNCHVKDCYVIGISKQQVGGLVGGAYRGSVNIENTGLENVTVTAPRYVGGMIGCSVGQPITVKNSYITGTVTAHLQEIVRDSDTIYQYGCEAGIIAGRVFGGSYTVENVLMNVKVTQEGKDENQPVNSDNLSQAGVFYAGKGSGDSYAPLWYEGIYCVPDFHAEAVLGIDQIEGFNVLNPYYFSQVTLDQLTGATAKETMVEFDFDTLWETTEGLPQLRFAELAAAEIAERGGEEEGDGEDDGNYNSRPVPSGKTVDTTDTSSTSNNTPATTGATEEKSTKKGCGSVIVGLPAIGSILLAGAFLLRKKKED